MTTSCAHRQPVALALALLLAACNPQVPRDELTPATPAPGPAAELVPAPPHTHAADAAVTRRTGRSPLRALTGALHVADGEAQVRDRVVVVFSAPIEPASFDPALDVALEPHVEIDWAWRDPRTLVGTTRTRLPAPSSIALTVGPELDDVHGRTLARAFQMQLVRPAPQILTTSLAMTSRADAAISLHDDTRLTTVPDDVRFVLSLDEAEPDLDALRARLALVQTSRSWEGVDQPLTREECFPEPARRDASPPCLTRVRRRVGDPTPLASAVTQTDCAPPHVQAAACVELRATELAAPGALVAVMLDDEVIERGENEVLDVAIAEPLEVVSVHCPDVAACHAGGPLQLVFNAPLAVTADEVPDVELLVDGVPVVASAGPGGPERVWIDLEAAVDTRVELTVARAVALDGRALAAPVERTVAVAASANTLDLERDLLVVDRRSPHLLVGEAAEPWRVDVETAPVEVERLVPLLAWLAGARDTPMTDHLALEPAKPEVSDYRKEEFALPLHAHVADDEAGAVGFRVQGDDIATHHGVVVFTSLGLTTHAGPNVTLAMVTDLASGVAAVGVDVALVDASGTSLHTVRTDSGGLAALPPRAELELASDAPLWLLASRTDEPRDVAVLRLPDAPALDTRAAIAGVVRTDRTLYVPGQTVRLVGQLRSWSAAGPAWLTDTQLEVALRRGWSDAPLAVEPIAASDLGDDGTLDTTFELPLELDVGGHEIIVRARDSQAHPGELSAYVWIATLGRDLLDVDVVPDAPRVVHGDPLGLTVTAHTVDGAPLAGRDVDLVIETVDSATRWPSCLTCQLEPPFTGGLRYTQTLELDDAGRARVELGDLTAATSALADLEITAELATDDGRVVSEQTRVTVDPAPFYLHVSRPAAPIHLGDHHTLDVCAVGPDGRRWRPQSDDWREGVEVELVSPLEVTTGLLCTRDDADDSCLRCGADLAGDAGGWSVRARHASWPLAEVVLKLWVVERRPVGSPSVEWMQIDAPDDLDDEVKVRFMQPRARRALATVGAHQIERHFALALEPERPASLSWTPRLSEVPASTLVRSTVTERTDWGLDVRGHDVWRPVAETHRDAVEIPTTSFELDVRVDAPTTWSTGAALPVRLEVRDAKGEPVADARVSLWVVDADAERVQPDARSAFHRGLLRTTSGDLVVTADSRNTSAERLGFTRPTHGSSRIGRGGRSIGVGRPGKRTAVWRPQRLDAPPAGPLAWAPALSTDAVGAVSLDVEVPLGVERVVVLALVARDLVAFGAARAEIAIARPLGASVQAPLHLAPGDRAQLVVTPLRQPAGRRVELTHAGWQASVDGAPVALELTSGDLESLAVGLDDGPPLALSVPTVTLDDDLAELSGLSVARYLETPDGDALDAEVVSLRPGNVVRSTLVISVDRERVQGRLRIVDRLPGGLETVDGRWAAPLAPAPVATPGDVASGADRVEIEVPEDAHEVEVTVHAVAMHAGWYRAPALQIVDAEGEPLGALDGHWTVSIER